MIPNHSKDIQNCSVPDVTSNHTVVDQGLGGSSNDPMVYDFSDDYMNVLNDDELVPNYSLDDMKFQDEEDNLTVKERPVEHQPVDEFIDVQKDKTTLLQENVKDQSNKPKYVNVVKDDYKPPLASAFACAKSKTKKCGIRKNYVLTSVKERKKKLAMALDSPFGQQGTTTPTLPKTRSMSSIGDTIVAPDFEEEVSGQPKMRSLNELMTIQEFVENLSRPHDCERDKVTVPDDISEYLQMQKAPEYRFPLGFWDIAVGRIFLLTLACLDKAKEGWLQDSKTLLVSFDMITHQFEVIDIPDIIFRALSLPLYISNRGNSLVLSGNILPPDYYVFCGELLSINVGSITSFMTIFTIPSPIFLKLLGFNNQDEPIVEAATNHVMAHSVQVYIPVSQSFENVAIQGNAGSFYIGPYKESLILATYPDHSLYCAG
ncbi:hypothetical protein Tco_0320999 [Tanacetum coccineum]